MKLVPARSYRQVMWNRYHNPVARAWWNDNVRIPLKRLYRDRCGMCGKKCDVGDAHHTKEAYKYVGSEHLHLDLMVWCHRECHEKFHKAEKRKKALKKLKGLFR